MKNEPNCSNDTISYHMKIQIVGILISSYLVGRIVMEDKNNIRLTAAESSFLWTQYINDSLSVCVNRYYLETVTDEEVKPIVENAIKASQQHIEMIKEIFKTERFPIPVGFTENDVDIKAPKLFSDTFILIYLQQMSMLGMAAGTLSLGLSTRPDVVDLYKVVLENAIKLKDQARDLLLKQGTYVKPPYVTTPNRVDFVKDQQFLTGFIGKKRPLTVHEITHLFINVQTNAIGKALIMGFAQTAKNEDVRQYLLRGKKIAQKHIDIFSKILIKEDLPSPMSWDSSVTDSTVSVFSDKLIMFHVSAMIAAGIGNYGAAIAASPRRDLGLKYASLIPEVTLYSEDGANIMITYGWLEEPPTADDRDSLTK